jgi:hypothetical protein
LYQGTTSVVPLENAAEPHRSAEGAINIRGISGKIADF